MTTKTKRPAAMKAPAKKAARVAKASPAKKAVAKAPTSDREPSQKKNQSQSGRGGYRPGAGRKPGIPNKVTTEFRDTVRRLLDENAANMSRWLALVAEGDGSDDAKPDPGKALDLLSKLVAHEGLTPENQDCTMAVPVGRATMSSPSVTPS